MTDFDRGKTFDTNYDAACKLIDKLTTTVKEQAVEIEQLRETNMNNISISDCQIKEQAAEIERLNKMIDAMAVHGAYCHICP